MNLTVVIARPEHPISSASKSIADRSYARCESSARSAAAITERSIDDRRNAQHYLIFKRPRDNLHPDRQPLGRAAHRHHRRRRRQRVEPLRVPHRIEVLHRRARRCVHARSPCRNAGTLATGQSSTGYSLISSSVFARSRSSSAHAFSSSVAVSGGAGSAIPRNSLKIGLSCSLSAANRRLVEHRSALHEERPPQLAQLLPAFAAGTAPRETPPRAGPAAALCTAARVSAVTGTRSSSSKNPIVFSRSSSGLEVRAAPPAGWPDRSHPARSACETSATHRRWCAPSARSRQGSRTAQHTAAGARVPGIRPGVGLSEQMPVKCAGTRTEPPLSLPSPAADIPAAIAADSPPLDPPGDRSRSHGLRVWPCSRLSVS